MERDTFLYTIGSVLGNIGGILGMFLGVSFVSLFKHLTDTLEKVTKYA